VEFSEVNNVTILCISGGTLVHNSPKLNGYWPGFSYTADTGIGFCRVRYNTD
jgi:hypothetical protein